MLHYVHQLLNFVCLLFGAGQVVCSEFLELVCWKQLSAAAAGNIVYENQNSKCAVKLKQSAKRG